MPGFALRRSLGIAQQVLNAADVEQLEPELAGKALAWTLFLEPSHMDVRRVRRGPARGSEAAG